MSLRIQQEALLANSIENSALWGWPVTVTSPAAQVESMLGLTPDIGEIVDVDTGVQISGRVASVSLRLTSLETLFGTIPEQIADEASAPWVVSFDDIGGTNHTFSVVESRPDRMLGVVVLILQSYVT